MAKGELIGNILIVFAILLTVVVLFVDMLYDNTLLVTTTQKLNNIMYMLMNISEQIKMDFISEHIHI